MTVVLSESAADDIADGYLFYEEQFEGLGDYFQASIFADLRSLILFAGIHEVHFGTFFRKIASRFPYAIYYTVDSDKIRVYAVMDTRRDPARIRERLSST